MNENKLEKKPDSTVEERENNGAAMSDERELNDKMKEEYESGEDKADKAQKLNEEEKQRQEGLLRDRTQV